MKKHIRIKAASCVDMINALNNKIQELDPGYIHSAESINAGPMYDRTDSTPDGFYSEGEMESIDRNGSDEELAIAAISYNYGISVAEARKKYEAIDDAKLQEFIAYYLDRGLPPKEQLARAADRRKGVGAACGDSDKQEVTAEEYIHGAENELVDEAYVDEMMQYVADETASLDNPSTCSWRVEGDSLIFVVAGIYTENVDEYTCPLADLTGDITTDSEYVLAAIYAEDVNQTVEV